MNPVVALVRRLAFVLVCLAGLVAGATAATAHSTLVESSPGPGETVASLDEIVLRFGDPIIEDPATVLALQTPDGTDIPIGTPEYLDPFTLRATVPHPPEPGSYVMRYQILAYDGDLNDGGHLFDFDPDAAANANATIILLAVGGAAVVAMIALLRPRRGNRGAVEAGTTDDHGAII